MAEFFSAKSQTLFDSVLWLPQAGATSGATGRPSNSYAILTDRGSIFVDAVYSWAMDGIGQIANAGLPPLAFVLTHGHVVEEGNALSELRNAYGAPFFLHPDDQRAGAKTSVSFMDPRRASVLTDAGLDVIEMPFHTPGSIMLHTERHRGIVFAGDSAVAPGPKQNPEPPRLERPRVETPERDEAFREQWHTLMAQRHISSILPLHGTPYVNRADLSELAKPLGEGEPMNPAASPLGEFGNAASGIAA